MDERIRMARHRADSSPSPAAVWRRAGAGRPLGLYGIHCGMTFDEVGQATAGKDFEPGYLGLLEINGLQEKIDRLVQSGTFKTHQGFPSTIYLREAKIIPIDISKQNWMEIKKGLPSIPDTFFDTEVAFNKVLDAYEKAEKKWSNGPFLLKLKKELKIGDNSCNVVLYLMFIEKDGEAKLAWFTVIDNAKGMTHEQARKILAERCGEPSDAGTVTLHESRNWNRDFFASVKKLVWTDGGSAAVMLFFKDASGLTNLRRSTLVFYSMQALQDFARIVEAKRLEVENDAEREKRAREASAASGM